MSDRDSTEEKFFSHGQSGKIPGQPKAVTICTLWCILKHLAAEVTGYERLPVCLDYLSISLHMVLSIQSLNPGHLAL